MTPRQARCRPASHGEGARLASRGMERVLDLPSTPTGPLRPAEEAEPAPLLTARSGQSGDSSRLSTAQGEAAWRINEAVMKERVAKDRVAFLLHRAPATSKPAPGLIALTQTSPWEPTAETTTREYHHSGNHQVGDEAGFREDKFQRRRDRMTEYFESKLMLGNIGFRKC